MNIPVGKAEEQRVRFSESDPFEKIKELMKTGFDGYLVATVEGASGLEEGILFLRGSELIGAAFDALRVDKQFFGIKALRLAFNLLKARKGVFDVNRLSKQQIDLTMAFSEKIRLPKSLDLGTLSRLEPGAYRPELVQKELALDLGVRDTRYNLLKRLGLGSI